jgi:hypothetical protein
MPTFAERVKMAENGAEDCARLEENGVEVLTAG